jgi:hypothetical protein
MDTLAYLAVAVVMIKESFIVIKLFYLSLILMQNKLESLFLEKKRFDG